MLHPSGRRGIRTPGTRLSVRLFSKQVHSASLSAFQVARTFGESTPISLDMTAAQSPRWESNPDNPLRRRAHYPLCYEAWSAHPRLASGERIYSYTPVSPYVRTARPRCPNRTDQGTRPSGPPVMEMAGIEPACSVCLTRCY